MRPSSSSFSLAPKLVLLVVTLGLTAAGRPARAEKNPHLPPPQPSQSVANPSTVVGWPADRKPIAPQGYTVEVFAELETPRSLYLLPSGDVMVSQAEKKPDDGGATSPDAITLFRMSGSAIRSRETFTPGLHLPFGMALKGDQLFVGEPERVVRLSFDGEKITGPAVEIARLPFPPPQRHWTRHLLLSADGGKLYVASGSASNVGEDGDPLDPMNAAILEMNPDGSDLKVFAGGLRNPVSMAWEPTTGELWTAVNERDELGDYLVPDYITHVARDGWYGWPYSYWGRHEDPRRRGERPDLVAKAIVPDFSMGSHSAALGITFTTGTKVPGPFNRGALVSLHGSWNSSMLVGYKVMYVPFENGQAADGEKDFLTGFIADINKSTVYGRPVSSAILADGTILVADDAGNRIWRVTPPAVR